MFDYQLFLGLPILSSYQEELNQLPSSLRDLFIQNKDSSYLQQIEYENVVYLGKSLGSTIETFILDAMQAHIYSLLRRLIPHYPYEQHPLLLLALPIKKDLPSKINEAIDQN